MMFQAGRLKTVSVLMIISAAVAGCGGAVKGAPKLYRVSGTVTYKGQPVAGAKVMFMGDGTKAPAVGVTDDAGRYSLSSLAGSGAVEGKHVVAIMKESEPDPAAKVNMSMEEAAEAAKKPAKTGAGTSLIPAKYQKPETSGLEFVVKPESNTIPIELN